MYLVQSEIENNLKVMSPYQKINKIKRKTLYKSFKKYIIEEIQENQQNNNGIDKDHYKK